ncbi:Transcription factor SPEECHLESS [Linum grandiflorum]
MGDSLLSGFLEDSGFANSFLDGANDLFSIFDSFHHVTAFPPPTATTTTFRRKAEHTTITHNSMSTYSHGILETEPKTKRQKTTTTHHEEVANPDDDGLFGGAARVSHTTVERNRRKQMNGHLSLLRSLMPSFYVKRGDQASIIGGVVEYIKELQQVLQSLEAKKQRKAYTEVLLSPRLIPSPRPIHLPPISPPTPQTPNTPFKHITTSLLQQQQQQQQHHHHHQMFTVLTAATSNNYSSVEPSPTTSSSSSSNNIILNDGDNTIHELVAKSRSSVADVEVKFSGANLVVKTVSYKIPGQVVKIISALEDMCLEILHVSINGVDDTMHNSFTIKVRIYPA